MEIHGPAIHPGEILRDELAALDVASGEFARDLRVHPSSVSRLLNGKQDMTPELALRIGQWFGTGPEVWLNLQLSHDLKRARKNVGPSLKGIARWGGRLPLAAVPRDTA